MDGGTKTRMVINQGCEANQSGREIENLIERLFVERGFHVVDGAVSKLAAGDLFAGDCLIRNAPFISIYGTKSRSEFVVDSRRTGRRIRIECKTQDVGGSVDEKFPYLFLNMRNQVVENEVVFVVCGDGFKKGAVEWLVKACADKSLVGGIKKSMIVLRGMEETRVWIKRFCRGEI